MLRASRALLQLQPLNRLAPSVCRLNPPAGQRHWSALRRLGASRAGFGGGSFSRRPGHVLRRGLPAGRPNLNRAVSAMAVPGVEPPAFPAVTCLEEKATAWAGDLLGVAVFEDELESNGDGGKRIRPGGDLAALDSHFGGALSDIVSSCDFGGKAGSSAFVRSGMASAPKRVGLVGMGAKAKAAISPEFGSSVYTSVGGAMAAGAKANKSKTAAVVLLGLDEDLAAVAGRLAGGLFLGAYEVTRFKAKPAVSPLESLGLLSSAGCEGVADAVEKAAIEARAVFLTRYLVEAPANVCTPQYMADAAKLIVNKFPDVLTLEVLEREDCEKLNMGCYLAVARGSSLPPKFIHITYKPKGAKGKEKKVALVGKGITFDSGGYNLKAGGGSLIESMKLDMGGAGAVLGAAMIVGGLAPPGVEAHFIAACCENMISGDAYRPGDVITASNGKTVEILNTDAEGRLALCDGLVYVQDQIGVEAVVDAATLTGACIVALGSSIGGMFTPSDSMAAQLKSASQTGGEKIWRMPLEEEYLELLKSPIADLKNVGSRWGGAITAALFLKEFVKTDTVEWAHLDIAGPAFQLDKGLPTGFAARTLAHWIVQKGCE